METKNLEESFKMLERSSSAPQESFKTLERSSSSPLCGGGLEKRLSISSYCSDSLAAESSSLIGDYIGMESCFDLRDNVGDEKANDYRRDNRCWEMIRKKKEEDRRYKKREFPPPIPSLVRTGNLPARMPWVMKRYYTSDGRLIIKEEKVKHHEYFRAHRENGRLTLHLVPLDDRVLNLSDSDEVEEEDDDVVVVVKEDQTVEDESKGTSVVESASSVLGNGTTNGGGIKGTTAGKCMNYSSMFGMPVASIRPVLS